MDLSTTKEDDYGFWSTLLSRNFDTREEPKERRNVYGQESESKLDSKGLRMENSHGNALLEGNGQESKVIWGKDKMGQVIEEIFDQILDKKWNNMDDLVENAVPSGNALNNILSIAEDKPSDGDIMTDGHESPTFFL